MTQKLSNGELIKKHHFWIVLGVGGVLLPVALWFYGVSNLQGMTDKERSARDQWHTRVNGVRPASHPNEKFTAIVADTQQKNTNHVLQGSNNRKKDQRRTARPRAAALHRYWQRASQPADGAGKPRSRDR